MLNGPRRWAFSVFVNRDMDPNNIEVISVGCFGWRAKNKGDGWWYIGNQLASKTKDELDIMKMEANLAEDVKLAAKNLVVAEFKDVESDMQYVVKFENDRKLWKLEVKSSPDAQIMKEDKKKFFGSEVWKLTCRRAVEILERSLATLNDYITPMVESGELMKVDEIAYRKVVDFLEDGELMKNIKLHKYIH